MNIFRILEGDASYNVNITEELMLMNNNDYLQDFLLAFNAVHEDYYSYYNQEMERPFAAELYHQWRMIIDKKRQQYDGLVLHSNIGKILADTDNEFTSVEFPDIVLHGNSYNRERNELIVEIKMRSYSDKDVRKLFDSIHWPNEAFVNCVYILYHKSKKQVTEYINKESLFQDFRGVMDNFYFLTKADGLFSFSSIYNYTQTPIKVYRIKSSINITTSPQTDNYPPHSS